MLIHTLTTHCRFKGVLFIYSRCRILKLKHKFTNIVNKNIFFKKPKKKILISLVADSWIIYFTDSLL